MENQEKELVTTSEVVTFEKKDYVFVEDIGVCRVDEIAKLTQKDGMVVLYYGFRSMMTQTKTAYIPVENHSAKLRKLVTLEEATSYLEIDEEKRNDLNTFEAKFVIAQSKSKLANKKTKK